MKISTRTVTYLGITILAIIIYYYILDSISPDRTADNRCLATICGLVTSAIIRCLEQIAWRVDNGVDILATLETDPEKVKNKMYNTMIVGHSDGFTGAMLEFEEIFKNYPDLELENWDVFQAWYKHQIDTMLLRPDIYNLTIYGDPYTTEADSYYNPQAPDWNLFN